MHAQKEILQATSALQPLERLYGGRTTAAFCCGLVSALSGTDHSCNWLARLFPDKLVLGMEIRSKVAEFVERKVQALRKEHTEKGDSTAYQNVSVVRANTMKYLCNFFKKGQLEKLLFLFPDPHFKAANHRRRIVNTHLLTEYAYVLRPGGILYTITDVQDVGDWMRDKLDAHPMFERLSDEELEGDPAAAVLATATEEGQKVRRNNGSTWRWCYRRRPAPVLPVGGAEAARSGPGGGSAG